MPQQPSEISHWASDNGKDFFPSKQTVSKIPNGYYKIKYNELGYFLSLFEEYVTESPINAIEDKINSVLEKVNSFWALEEDFRKLKVPFNKTIIMFGRPGNGRNNSINVIASENVKNNGVVIEVEEPEDYTTFISSIKKVEESSKIVLVIKNVDCMMEKFGIFPVVDMIEKINLSNNTVCLMTADSLEKISPLIQSSSKCFDTKFKFDNPPLEERESFIKEKLQKLGKKITKKELEKISKDTEDFSFDEMKRLLIFTYLYKEKYDEKLEEIKKIKNKYINESFDDDERTVLGFKSN